MRSVLIAFAAAALMVSVALADTTVEDVTITDKVHQRQDRIVTDDSDYDTLQLIVTIPHQLPNTPMEISCDGRNYYAINGGVASSGVVEKYDLNGHYIQSVSTGLDNRALFYNPHDGNFYCKNYGQDLFQIDVETGTSSMLYSNIFHNYQSKLAYNMRDNYIYEMVEGDVYVVDFATGNTVNTMHGFQCGGWGRRWCIATEYSVLFTWDDNRNCYIYEFDGRLINQVIIPTGSSTWGFGYTNSMLFTCDDSYGNSEWYGHGPFWLMDSCLCADITILTPYVPSINGNIEFSVTVVNCGVCPLPVYGEIYPTIGPCYTGTIYDLDIIRMLHTCLYPEESFTGYYFYNVGNVSRLNLGLCGLTIDAGFAPNNYLHLRPRYCDEFMFFNPWARSSGPVEWGTEWREITENLPVSTALQQNYPNPFNAKTTIEYDLPSARNVKLDVNNLIGQRVATMVDGWSEAGRHSVSWDASSYSSGIYFYKLTTGSKVLTKRMTLLK